jgi:RNA polymerase sigma-70 factor (ECF subfamily)
MLRLVPNLRAFAVSLCGNIERADDLVQAGGLKAWNSMDGFE